jgi:hypothetical protein
MAEFHRSRNPSCFHHFDDVFRSNLHRVRAAEALVFSLGNFSYRIKLQWPVLGNRWPHCLM